MMNMKNIKGPLLSRSDQIPGKVFAGMVILKGLLICDHVMLS